MKDLVVVGSGGLGIVNLINDINADKPTYNFLGFLEKDESLQGTEVLGCPILGSDDLLLTQFKHCCVVNNVMQTPRLHKEITDKLISLYHVSEFPNLIHPNVEKRWADIGNGNILYSNSILAPKSRIGDFNISYSAHIGHETIVGNYNLMAGTLFGSRCKIGSFNLFGNATTVTNSCKIGDDNVIGVGSVVMKNVKSGHHLIGYPAIEADEFARRYLSTKK